MSAEIIQIFGAASSIAHSPMASRARMAWAQVRLVAGSARSVGGIMEGDAVRVMVGPQSWRAGTLQRWERAAATGSLVLVTHTVGRVLLAPGQEPVRNKRDGMITAPRTRIAPARITH